MTFLFDKIIFGPVKSRRLGISLGINLLPETSKYCNFDCIYCECGWTPDKAEGKSAFHSREEVSQALELKFKEMKAENNPPDVITFAGNGEPTLHPEFPDIIDDTIHLRNQYFPEAKIAVLSNATRIKNERIFESLLKIDQNIQKIDSPFEHTIHIINRPKNKYSLRETIDLLKRFNGKVIIQSMFIKGEYMGEDIDNTSDEKIIAWIGILKEIAPEEVMIYTIARDTPTETLKAVDKETLLDIAKKVETNGMKVQVSA